MAKRTEWKLFQFFPPLIFIYLLPAIFSNTGIIPLKCDEYTWMKTNLLPFFLLLLLLDIDVKGAIRVMGRGILLMLAGTPGVVLGAPLAMLAVGQWLSEEAWKGDGALAGSWIGGTGNMAAFGAV